MTGTGWAESGVYGEPLSHRPDRGEDLLEEVLVRVQTHHKIDRLARELAEKNAEVTRTNEKLADEIARREAHSRERNHLADQLSEFP